MRQFYTAVVERKESYQGTFATHPYEAAWASEAIFFVRVEELQGSDSKLNAVVQISADGVRWVDEGTRFVPMQAKGNYFVKVSHFGGWLRLAGDVAGQNADMKLTIHLVLKE